MRKVYPTLMAWMENLSEKIRHLANHSRKMSFWTENGKPFEEILMVGRSSSNEELPIG
jgi:hypothetical protein